MLDFSQNRTGFARELTGEEIKVVKECARQEVEEIIRTNDAAFIDLIKSGWFEQYINSIDNDTFIIGRDVKCTYKWYQSLYGVDNPKVKAIYKGKEKHLYCVNGVLCEVLEYNNTTGIVTSPVKSVRNMRELRRYMRKDFYAIPEVERRRIEKFFLSIPKAILFWN